MLARIYGLSNPKTGTFEFKQSDLIDKVQHLIECDTRHIKHIAVGIADCYYNGTYIIKISDNVPEKLETAYYYDHINTIDKSWPGSIEHFGYCESKRNRWILAIKIANEYYDNRLK